MVDLNNNKKMVMVAAAAAVLAVLIVAAGFMTGKYSAIKPVEKVPDSQNLIAKVTGTIDTATDQQIEFYKQKQALEEQAKKENNSKTSSKNNNQKKSDKINKKGDSKAESEYLNYKASDSVSVYDLADKYDVSSDELAKINSVEKNHIFVDGDIVLIPILKDPSVDGNG